MGQYDASECRITRKEIIQSVLTASVGGLLEMYDFVIYVFFAPVIARLFFSEMTHFASLVAAFGIFAAGYLVRPIGGVLFAHMGDRLGRKKGLMWTIVLMGGATTLMGIVPTYQSIGLWAPVIFLFLRVVQGLAVGGDLPGAMTYVAEVAPCGRRGLCCALVYCGVNAGILLSSAVVTLIMNHTTTAQLYAWGWRLGFLSSVLLLGIGIYVRLLLQEPPVFQMALKKKRLVRWPVLELFKREPQVLLRTCLLMCLYAALISQIFLFMPTFLTHVGVHADRAFRLNTLAALWLTVMIPFMGWMSDQWGRKPILFLSSILFLTCTIPLYHIMIQHAGHGLSFAPLLLFALMSAMYIGPMISMLTEQYPTEIRYSGIAVSYNICFALIGGLTPLVCTVLMHKWGALAVSWNLIWGAILACIMTCPLFSFMPETKGQLL